MERSARDQANYNRDYQHFIQNLQKFHGSRGSGFKKVPFFGGKELDLLLLYKTVTSLGGCSKVTDEKKWRDVAKCFNLPSSCTNAAFSLRQYYLRYLASYEKLNFLGEDVDDNSSDIRRASSSLFLQQSSINFAPTHYQEPMKKVELGPFGEPKVNNFDRLIFALVSGLPNEVDFALNICTLLSNVTNSIFNLAKAPSIVDLMLAHVGIFTEGDTSMRELYKEWYQESDRDFDKFWKETIDDKTVKEIFNGMCGCNAAAPADDFVNLFNPNTSKLAESVEAKRVNQICVILHNFSYEELNCMFIASHLTCRRFLTLCAGSKLTSLRKTALDALDNLADKITLNIIQDDETQKELKVLQSFLFSNDRQRKVRAISILAKLSSHEENEDVLSEAIPDYFYEELIRCLTIPDIQLILNALDALYYLSDLGEATATAIVMVYKSIDILVCLVTVHAESYGNRAITGFRIVENKNSLHAQKHAALQQNLQRNMAVQQMQRNYTQMHPPVQQSGISQFRSSPKSQVVPALSPVRQEPPKPDENEEVEPEIFAARWISAYYELAPGNEIQRSQVFADYIESCKEIGRKGVLNAQNFFKILGLVIPAPYWRPNEANRDDPTITGIKRRANPLFVKNKGSKTSARIPDVSSQRREQSMPIRPIPVMPGSPALLLKPQSIQGNLLRAQDGTASPLQGQQQLPRPVLVQTSLPSQAQIQPKSMAPATSANQEIPLRLLEQHVNSQGQGKDPPSSATPKSNAGSSDKDVTPSVAEVQQSNPSHTGNTAQLQVPGIVQSAPGNVPQDTSNVLLGNVNQTSQSPLLSNQGVVSNLTVAASPELNSQSRNILDSNMKLKSQQKLSAKEKNERKKAMKAARDMINADIRASNLDPLTQCQNLTERIQKEMQQHFVQFHMHQQSIQAIQAQLQQLVLQNQQAKLPQNVMDDINTRVRSHHAQMQAHYQKLQQLQLLLQQVKIRLTQEQKLKDPTAAVPDTSSESVALNMSKTPKSSRVPKKLSATSMPANLANQLQNSQAAYGLTAVQPGNGAQPLAVASIQQMQQFAIAVNQPVTGNVNSVASTSGADVSKGVAPSQFKAAEDASQVNQAMPTMPGVSTTQVGLLAANTPVQIQTSQIPAHMLMTGSAALNPQTATSVKQAGAQILPKSVAITFNTPILPRPPTSASSNIQSVAAQSLPNSGFGGPAVLFTMPMVAVPPQGTLQSTPEERSSQTPVQNTADPSKSKRDNVTMSNTTVITSLARVNNENIILAEESSISTSKKNATITNGIMCSLSPALSSTPCTVTSNGTVSPEPKNSATLVNGKREGAIGKGSQPSVQEVQLSESYNPSNVIVNGKVNGISSFKENSTKFPDTVSKNMDVPEVLCTDDDLKKVVNGDRESSVGKGLSNCTEESHGANEETRLKRKLEDSQKTDTTKSRQHDMGIDKTKEHDKLGDFLYSKYDSVIKNNKKLKLNGVYVNNCKENVDIKEMDTNHSEDISDQPGHLETDDASRNQRLVVAEETGDSSGQSSKELKIGGLEQSDKERAITEIIANENIAGQDKNVNCPDSNVNNLEGEVLEGTSKQDSKEQVSQDLGSKGHQRLSTPEEHSKSDKEKQGERKCQWSGCKGSFATSNDLLAHMVFSHAPQEGSMKACKVAGCKPVQRPRGSMICHFNQVHCNTSTVHDDEQVTLPQLLFPKVVDIEREDESPVTRTVRLTAALILRNIARNSPHGRKVILSYETRLVPSAMSASEASSAVSACLEELSRKRRKPSGSNTDDVAS